MAGRRCAIILAAGASRRMGTPKALLPWGDSTLLESIIQTATAVMDDIVVVLGPTTQHLTLSVRTVFNPEPETGRSASIRLAASVVEAADAILIQSVDQPVPARVISALLDALAGDAQVAVPTYRGRRGHPVCISGQLLDELRNLSEKDQGLRAVVRRHSVREVPVDEESVTWNLNDPAAYAHARAAR